MHVEPRRISEAKRLARLQPPRLTPRARLPDAGLIDRLEEEIAARALRVEMFGGALFRDPAWDILLELVLAGLEGRHMSTSSTYAAARIPQTTALRHIGWLVEHGYVRREPAPDGRRRGPVVATGAAVRTIERYFRQIDRRRKQR